MRPNYIAQNSETKKSNCVLSGLIAYDKADYGGGFANYTPPTPKSDFDIRVVEDTNATTPGKRLYIYVSGSWHYAELS